MAFSPNAPTSRSRSEGTEADMPSASTSEEHDTSPSPEVDSSTLAAVTNDVQNSEKPAPTLVQEHAQSDVRRFSSGWITLALTALALSWMLSGVTIGDFGRSRISENQFPQLLIDINTADEAELSTLPGVGKSLAQSIIRFRSDTSKITDPSQLKLIPGIGPKRAAELTRLIAWPQPPEQRMIFVDDRPASSALGDNTHREPTEDDARLLESPPPFLNREETELP